MLLWLEDTSVSPPKLHPQMLWQSLTSFLTQLFFCLLMFFYIKLSNLDMWFRTICPDPTTYYFIHKHNQIRNLQKLQLDTKQTDIKMLQFFFFSVLLPYFDSTSTKIKHGHLKWNMYPNVYKLLFLKYRSSHSDTDSVWIIHVKYFFSWTVNEGLYREKNHTYKLTGQKVKSRLKPLQREWW